MSPNREVPIILLLPHFLVIMLSAFLQRIRVLFQSPPAIGDLLSSEKETKVRVPIDIAIIGGGIGGLTAALALQQAGFRPRLYERDDVDYAHGKGYFLVLDHGLRVLRLLGVEDTTSIADAMGSFAMVDAATLKPHCVLKFPEGFQIPQRYVRRKELHDTLLRACEESGVELHFEHKLESVTQHGLRWQLAFENKSSVECDLLVGADGLNSVVREHVLQGGPLFSLGLTQIGFALRKDAGVIETLKQKYPLLNDHRTIFFLSNNGQSIFLAMNLIGFVISESEEYVHSHMGKDAQSIQQFLLTRAKDWHPMVSELIRNMDEHFPVRVRSIRDRPPLALHANGRPWAVHAGDSVTVLGDAAHPMTPYRGQGANQAMLDAISLTEHLMRHLSVDMSDVSTSLFDQKHLNVVAALKAYEREMIARTSPIVATSHSDGRMYHATQRWPLVKRSLYFFALRCLFYVLSFMPTRSAPKKND